MEFLDEVELELDGNPGGEFKGDVLVGISPTVASSFRNKTDGPGAFEPLFRGKGEAIQTSLHFNPVEFDGIKIGVVELLPDSKEFDRIAVSEPVPNEVVCSFWVSVTGDVGQADVIFVLLRKDAHDGPLDLNAGFDWLFHCGCDPVDFGNRFTPVPAKRARSVSPIMIGPPKRVRAP